MNQNTGKLLLKPVYAELKLDKDIILKQDPYCMLHFGTRKFKTKTDRGGGKHPKWSDCFEVLRTNEDLLRVEVWDRDFLSRDDFLGQGSIAVSAIQPGKSATWIDLFYQGRNKGKLLLETEFTPDYLKGGQQYMMKGQQFMPTNQQYMSTDQQYITSGQQYMPSTQQSIPTGQQYMPTTQQSMPTGQQYMPPTTQTYTTDTRTYGSTDQNYATGGQIGQTYYAGDPRGQGYSGQAYPTTMPATYGGYPSDPYKKNIKDSVKGIINDLSNKLFH